MRRVTLQGLKTQIALYLNPIFNMLCSNASIIKNCNFSGFNTESIINKIGTVFCLHCSCVFVTLEQNTKKKADLIKRQHLL